MYRQVNVREIPTTLEPPRVAQTIKISDPTVYVLLLAQITHFDKGLDRFDRAYFTTSRIQLAAWIEANETDDRFSPNYGLIEWLRQVLDVRYDANITAYDGTVSLAKFAVDEYTFRQDF